MPFKSVINEYYARDISKKVRSAKRIRAMNGEHHGRAPFGYLLHPSDKHKLIVDEESAKTVRWMFEMAASGLGKCAIASRLYKAKILTPAAYEFQRTGRLANMFDHNCPWDWEMRSVEYILKGQVYLGHMVNHRQMTKSFKNKKIVNVPEDEWIIVRNTHEAIINEELFDKVQRIISVKTRKNGRNEVNIFAGLLVCPDCGRHMPYSNGRYRGGKGGYNCDSYRHGVRLGADRKCSSHSIGLEPLETAVLNNINAVIRGSFNQENYLKSVMNHNVDTQAADKKSLEKLTRRESELKSLVKKVFEQNVAGRINDATFTDLYTVYQNELSDVTVKIESLRKKMSDSDKDNDGVERFLEMARRHTEIEILTRDVLLDLIDKIVVYEATGIGNSRKQSIEIYYRFVGQLPNNLVSL